MHSSIYYFCYGSNLLIQRMRIYNKSACKHANAILPGYQLTFSGHSNVWQGSTANIIKNSNSKVYGAVYTLSKEDILNLDRQEIGYDAIEVDVNLENDNQMITCRTYVQKPDYMNKGNSNVPSKLYKNVIIKGAEENQLPKDYIDNVIRKFPDNGIIDCGPEGLDPSIKNIE